MQTDTRGGLPTRLLFGLVVVVLGFAFLLDNLNILELDAVWPYAPIVIVVWGLILLVRPSPTGRRTGGFIVTIIGLLLLNSSLHLLPYGWEVFWPVVIILFGAWMALRGLTREGRSGGKGADVDTSATTSDFAMMAGLNRKNASKAFRGGEVTAVMGGCELDLRDAKIAGGEAVIEVFALWGGIDIKVPGDWTVVNNVTPLLGGSEDTRKVVGSDPTQRLVVQGFAVMGGIEISNK